MLDNHPHPKTSTELMEEHFWEQCAQKAAMEYRDLIGQEAYDTWCGSFGPGVLDKMRWRDIFNMLQTKIRDFHNNTIAGPILPESTGV